MKFTPRLLVNPYDSAEMAEAIRRAIEMPPEERKSRMGRMRQVIRGRPGTLTAPLKLPFAPQSLPRL